MAADRLPKITSFRCALTCTSCICDVHGAIVMHFLFVVCGAFEYVCIVVVSMLGTYYNFYAIMHPYAHVHIMTHTHA